LWRTERKEKEMKKGRKFLVAAGIALLVAFLFWHPFTRMIVLWILPLGSGIDDLIIILALIFGGVFALWHILSRKVGK